MADVGEWAEAKEQAKEGTDGVNVTIKRPKDSGLFPGFKIFDVDFLVSCSGSIFKISIEAENSTIELDFGGLEAAMLLEAIEGVLKPQESELSPASPSTCDAE